MLVEGEAVGREQGIYGNSVLPSQFCYEPRTAVEKKDTILTFDKTLMLIVVDSNHIFKISYFMCPFHT